jgi:hypothetical protein
MSADLDAIRSTHRLEDLIHSFTGHPLKRKGHELWTVCPFHDDRDPSLRINPDKQTWFCDPCNEGGDVFRFVEKFRGISFEAAVDELQVKAPVEKVRGPARIAAEYLYPAIDDTPDCKLVRRLEYDDDCDPLTGKPRKEFRQLHKDADGEWVYGAGDPPLGVYRLSAIRGHRIVYYFEGEKCADAAAALGLPTTTTPGGAGKALPGHVAQWKRAGIEAVVIFPDNDTAGEAGAKKTALLVISSGLKVKLVRLPDLPPKGDIVEWIEAGHTKDDLIEIVKRTPLFDQTREEGVLPNSDEAYQFRVLNGSGYELHVPRLGIELKVSGVRRHSHGEVTGLMTTRVNFPGAKIIPLTNNVINSAELNLAADRSRRERAKNLAERAMTGDEIDWIGLVDTFCIKCIDAETVGTTELPMHQIVVGESYGEFMVGTLGYSLLRGQPTLWFGDGGTGKSTQAVIVAIELARTRSNVLYLDWESADVQHKSTYDKYLGSDTELPGRLIYRSLDRPLVQEAARIHELIVKYQIDLVVIDSVGFACDGSPESAEAATTTYRSLRSFGNKVSTLLIAHVNRSEQGDQKPFGSVFWANGARNMWYLKRSEVDMNEGEFTVGFYHRKSNMGPLRPPFGVRLTFQPDALIASPANLSEISELALKQPVWQRIKQYLERASMPVDESMLSSELELPANVVQKTVSRFTNTFYKETDGRVGLRLVSNSGEVF